jgi:hypothetical protein
MGVDGYTEDFQKLSGVEVVQRDVVRCKEALTASQSCELEDVDLVVVKLSPDIVIAL